MLRFATRRSLQAIVAIVAMTLLVYLGLFVWRDPFAVSESGRYVPQDIQDALRAKFGMDRSLVEQYLIYLKNLSTADLGIDFEYRRPVVDLVFAAVPKTVGLVLIGVTVQMVLGVLAGVVAAVTRRPYRDALITTSTTVLYCLPVFVLTLLARKVIAGWEIFGVEIFAAVPHRFVDDTPWITEALLPGLCIGVLGVGIVARVSRGAMVEAMSADYVRTARGKGISERRVVFVHALRNALVPVTTLLGIELGTLLGGTFIVEGIFDYEGVGYLFLRAIRKNNDPVILAVTVYLLVAYIVISAFVDLVYARLDPRIRIN